MNIKFGLNELTRNDLDPQTVTELLANPSIQAALGFSSDAVAVESCDTHEVLASGTVLDTDGEYRIVNKPCEKGG